MNAVQAQTGMMSATGVSGTKAEQKAAASGDFMAMFMQMLSGQTGNGDLSALLGSLGQQSDEDNVNASAMEMAAALLGGGSGYNLLSQGLSSNNAGGNSELNALLSGISGTNSSSSEALAQLQKLYQGDSTSSLEGSGSESPVAEILGNALAQAQKAQNAASESALAKQNAAEEAQIDALSEETQKNPETANVRPSDFVPSSDELSRLRRESNGWKLTASQTPKYLSEEPIRVVNDATTQEDDMYAFYSGSMGFQSAVAQARKMMGGDSATEDGSDSDGLLGNAPSTFAESIMANQANQVNGANASSGAVERITVDDLAGQLEREVASTGRGETKRLSFKLSPEGLGDVAIQLTRKEGQILVSIVTASESTARMLNEQMSQMKNNLQATQSENVTVSVTQQENHDAMQQFNQSNQSQYGNDQASERARQNAVADRQRQESEESIIQDASAPTSRGIYI